MLYSSFISAPTPEVCANIEAIVSFFEAKEKENYNSIESELQLPSKFCPIPIKLMSICTLV